MKRKQSNAFKLLKAVHDSKLNIKDVLGNQTLSFWNSFTEENGDEFPPLIYECFTHLPYEAFGSLLSNNDMKLVLLKDVFMENFSNGGKFFRDMKNRGDVELNEYAKEICPEKEREILLQLRIQKSGKRKNEYLRAYLDLNPDGFAELKNKIDFETQGIKSVLENFDSGEAFVDLIVESVNSRKDKKEHYSKEDWLLEGMMRRIGDALTMLEFSQDFALCEKIMDFAKSKNLFSDNSIWELGVMHFLSSGGDLSSIQKIFHREEFSTFQKLMNGTQGMEEKAEVFYEFLTSNVKPDVSQKFQNFTYDDWGFVKRILAESEEELKERPALQRGTFLKRISGMLQVCPLAPNDFILPKEKRDLLFDTFNQEVGSLKTAWCWEQKQIDAFMPVFEKNMIKAVALDEKVETSKPRFTKI